MSLKMKIMLRAVEIRMKNGEEIEAILASYPKLTTTEKSEIRKEINPREEVTL